MLCFVQSFLEFGIKVKLTSQQESSDMIIENCFKIIQCWGAVWVGSIKQNWPCFDDCGAER